MLPVILLAPTLYLWLFLLLCTRGLVSFLLSQARLSCPQIYAPLLACTAAPAGEIRKPLGHTRGWEGSASEY